MLRKKRRLRRKRRKQLKYRVDCALWFENEAQARGIYNALKNAFGQAVSPNAEEKKRVSLHRCYHDETPLKPCERMEEEEDA